MHASRDLRFNSRLGRCTALAGLLLILAAVPVRGAGTLTGTVFRDFDADGAAGPFEPGVAGITVTAYDSAGAAAGSTTTCSATGVPVPACTLANLGFYELAVGGTGPYRLEFTGLPAVLRSGPFGADSGTRVRFVDDPAGGTAANLDLGLANPAQHCLPDTRMATPCYVNGDPLATPPGSCPGEGAPAGDLDAFVSFLDSANSNNGTGVVHVADADVLGSVWGLAWQRTSGSLFAAAMLKRHTGFGPPPAGSAGSRTGVIYRLSGDFTVDDAATVEAWFNLDDIPGVDTGAEPAARGLDACSTEPSYDPGAFDGIGKVGLGDLDIGDDGQTLWVVNLFDRTLYELAIGDPPQPPTAAEVTAHPFGAAEPACAGGVFRPWAVKVHDGLVYVGGVCSGENGGTAADLTAHVLAHDPAGAAGNFTPVFDMDLDYPRGKVSDSGSNEPPAEWRPWIDQWSDIIDPPPGGGPFTQTMYPQPMLTDLELDIDGSLLLGFLDRAGHQLGNRNYQTDGIDTTTYEGVVAGDLLRVCFDPDDGDGNGNPYVLELDSDCPGPLGPTLPVDQVPGQGPGGREWYWTDYYRWDNNPSAPDGGTHQEITLGGLAHRMGSGEIGASAFDPFDDFRAGGVIWMSNAAGTRTHSLEVFGLDAGGQPATFGKAAGIGDLELMCDRAPLELGDRVWCDTDGDGVQEGGEPPVPGVDVVLTCGGDGPVTDTTDAAGRYLFTDAGYQSANGTPIPRGAACTVAIDVAANLAALNAACGPGAISPTVSDTGAGPEPDLNDSDGADSGGGVVEAAIADTGGDGDNDHTYDFGFVVGPEPIGTIGDTVWCDGLEGTGNGTFDAGEGVAGVAVSLFEDTNCDDSPDGPSIATEDTAGDGQYLFTDLPVGPPGDPLCYVVQVDAADPQLGTCTAPITPVATAPDLDSDTPDDLDNDFGFEEPLGTGSIGDTVWCDGVEGSGNGVFDAGEGVAGVAVSLFEDTNCDDSPDGPAIATEDTVGDGQYIFTRLEIGPPGDPVCYVVQVDAADPELGTCTTPITPVETAPDLDSDTPNDLDNDFGFEEPCDDPDGDRICNESCTEDRDGDGDPDCTDDDPQGFLYCEENGALVTGGTVEITGPGVVTLLEDGSTGRYSFLTDGTPGQYAIAVTPPAGTSLSETCLDLGVLDPTGEPSPLVLGAGEDLDSGFLTSSDCAGNPYYLTFDLEPGDPIVINNNLPLQACGVSVIEIPTQSPVGLVLLALLLGAIGAAVLGWRARASG